MTKNHLHIRYARLDNIQIKLDNEQDIRMLLLNLNLVSSSMTDISKQIYQFLCDRVVGSEKVVKYRRLFFKTYEYTQNNCLSLSKHLITSGSKAEGLGLPGSDLDSMRVSKEHIVHEPKLQPEEISAGNNILSLIIDNDNAQPGFVLLKIDDRSQFDFDDTLIL